MANQICLFFCYLLVCKDGKVGKYFKVMLAVQIKSQP